MNSEIDLEVALNEAVAAAMRAGDLIVEWSSQAAYEVRQKQGAELVTTADLRSDEIIREHLGSRFPQHRFLSEEVAAGRLDAHSESLAPWDVAAASLIATEAGAVRGNLLPEASSLPTALRGAGFIVATPGIFEQLYKLLSAQ